MKKAFLLSFCIMMLAVFSGCASEKYGAGIDKGIPEVKVKDIYLDSGIVGKKVTLQGTIASQCGSNGCWFVLHDDTGQIFVNLGPAKLTLPPRINKSTRVSGIVYPVQGELQLIAQGVEVSQ